MVFMSTITGVVTNGVVVPSRPLPEGAQVEIQLQPIPSSDARGSTAPLQPADLRRLPRDQRQALLAFAAELAESDYRFNKELTGFEAFADEEEVEANNVAITLRVMIS
jgi:hypothetical protein